MKDRTLVATLVLAVSLVAACADSGGESAPLRREARAITRDDGVTFVATIGEASFRTEYTATTTLHEIVLGGRTVVHHGTASEGWSSKAQSSALDSDGFATHLDDDDRALLERALVVIHGASGPPSARERARARFGAAYAVARVLGLVTRDPDRWPYPGFDDDMDAPEELGLGASASAGDGKGRQGYIPTPSFGCCGPKNCTSCVAGSLPCEDWCAAGDACNARFGNTNNRCGTANLVLGNGDNKCPHSNGSCILAAGGPIAFCNAFRAGTARCK